MTAALVLQFLKASPIERDMLRRIRPDLFNQDFDDAIAEADEMLNTADAHASDIMSTVSAVATELELPPEVAAMSKPTVSSRERFLVTLSQMIAEQFQAEEDDDDEEEEHQALETPASAAPIVSQRVNRIDDLMPVMHRVVEFLGCKGALMLEMTSRSMRALIVTSPDARALWLGLAMREYPAAAKALITKDAAEALTADWRSLVLLWSTQQR